MPDPDLEIKAGGAVNQTLRKGEGGLQKNFVRPFGPQFGPPLQGIRKVKESVLVAAQDCIVRSIQSIFIFVCFLAW